LATVLIVEDEFLVRNVLQIELEEAGYDVILADNADAALQFSKPARTSIWSSPTSTCQARWTD